MNKCQILDKDLQESGLPFIETGDGPFKDPCDPETCGGCGWCITHCICGMDDDMDFEDPT